MVMLHAFLSLLAGFVTMTLIVIVLTALVTKLIPDWVGADANPRPAYSIVNLGYSFLSAAAGGYVTAWLSTANPLIQVLVLAIVVLAMSALSALQARGKQPIWYAIALLALMPVGVFAGGLLRLRVLGIL
ncbi:MAG: hypothetical protein ABSF53_04005 [Terracidiphilus sp.]